MLLCKNYTKNKTISYLASLFIALAVCYQTSAWADTCTKYMNSSDAKSVLEAVSDDTAEYSDINEALLQSSSGDVICFRSGVYSAIRLEEIQGGEKSITLQASPGNQVIILSSGYSGTGIYINNSKNIIVSGFNVTGGLYGIYATGSSDLTINNNTIYDVGQEAIIVKSGMSNQSLENFLISNNVITGTGKTNSQYGEGIYVGDGNDFYNETLHDIIIENNNISNTLNEAIDIKVNTNNVVIDSNAIVNTNLKFNGVITVATSDRFGEEANITIHKNSIVGVINRSGYRAIGIAVGHGNASISDNMIIAQEEKFAGICLFSTFMNEEANTVTISGNKFITNGSSVIENCGSGGTGATSLAHVVYNDL